MAWIKRVSCKTWNFHFWIGAKQTSDLTDEIHVKTPAYIVGNERWWAEWRIWHWWRTIYCPWFVSYVNLLTFNQSFFGIFKKFKSDTNNWIHQATSIWIQSDFIRVKFVVLIRLKSLSILIDAIPTHHCSSKFFISCSLL